jgi:hypothetical protein
MLNPNLFKLLERRFGKGNVKVTSENIPMTCSYGIDPLKSFSDIRYKLNFSVSGEEYVVRCPFCRDYKQRLHINHRWGVYDEKTNNKNLWIANCYNQQCLRNYQNQLALYDQVVDYINIGQVQLQPQLVRSERLLAVRAPRNVELPGAIWPLDHMKIKSPRHKAIQYVEDRLWNPTVLGKQYQVGYCIDSVIREVRNRIVAPIFLDRKLVSWQARYLGDIEKGSGIPKWYSCSHVPIGKYLYNYDVMRLHQTKVIVEGPGDVWSFGPQACGIFNKVMTVEQRKLFCASFGPDDVAVILLDPGQDAVAIEKASQHHIEKLYNELMREPRLNSRVIKVYLPHNSDPDELDREYMHALIKAKARENNLIVDFSRPRE